MKKILALSLVLLSMFGFASESKVDLELDVFGLSYHTNRDYNFNEVNPGLGASLVFHSVKENWWHPSMVVSSGVYKDSYSNAATYLLAGPRLTFGYDNSFHVSADVQSGYLKGSGHNGFAYVPFVAIGYDRYSLGITGDPIGQGNKNAVDYTKVVAVFLKFRVLDF